MTNWWAEEWSIGSGRARTLCGIARTDDGYAVDVFRGDTCLDSFEYRSRSEAIQAAHTLKLQYQRRRDLGTIRHDANVDW